MNLEDAWLVKKNRRDKRKEREPSSTHKPRGEQGGRFNPLDPKNDHYTPLITSPTKMLMIIDRLPTLQWLKGGLTNGDSGRAGQARRAYRRAASIVIEIDAKAPAGGPMIHFDNSADILFYKEYPQMELGDIPLEHVKNVDVFAWTSNDVGIYPSIAVHILNIDPIFLSGKQKKRHFGPKKDKIIEEEEWQVLRRYGNIKEIEVNLEKIRAIQEMKPPINLSKVQRLAERITALSRFVSRSVEQRLSFFKALRKTKNFVWDEECQQGFQDLKAYLAKLPMLTKLTPGKAETSGRMVKWTIELSKYDIFYQPKSIIKAQALAEFMNEATLMEEEESSWLLHAHGSSTLAGSGAGVVLTSPEGDELAYALRFNFKALNNEFEYEALIAGIMMALDVGARNLITYFHSQLVTNQVEGKYEIKAERMKHTSRR
ncbi:UNVERIFIED_CONTAM: hypothetical protein Scaly_2994200 [Sesamum calycinum]|uniref:RNase H type-1 domain-containing protein n=1 Tax=Sesamum calycinum TaxID=2727403 RepID=A0AAW2KFH4_9LAMI